jgi:Flp pilus assembly secretin CpaC
MIVLDLNIVFDDFISSTDFSDADKNVREIKTTAIASDKEVLALGGLIRTRAIDNMSKTPALGDIPLLGWLFKNKQKQERKENLLILISVRIVNPHETEQVKKITQDRVDQYQLSLGQMHTSVKEKDPITKLFFDNSKDALITRAESLMFTSQATFVANKRNRVSRKRIAELETQKKLEEAANVQPAPVKKPAERTLDIVVPERTNEVAKTPQIDQEKPKESV